MTTMHTCMAKPIIMLLDETLEELSDVSSSRENPSFGSIDVDLEVLRAASSDDSAETLIEKIKAGASASSSTANSSSVETSKAVGDPKAVCAREGCDRPLAYEGAEYCGAACSAQRREPKLSSSDGAQEGVSDTHEVPALTKLLDDEAAVAESVAAHLDGLHVIADRVSPSVLDEAEPHIDAIGALFGIDGGFGEPAGASDSESSSD